MTKAQQKLKHKIADFLTQDWGIERVDIVRTWEEKSKEMPPA